MSSKRELDDGGEGQAKRRKLPAGWIEKVSKKNGKVYYWNTLEKRCVAAPARARRPAAPPATPRRPDMAI